MTTALEQVLTQLATLEASITGVSMAYDQTPEALGDFPCFINYPLSGEAVMEAAGQVRGLYTVVAELHVARGALPEAEATARPFINRFEDAIFADVTLGGTVDTVTAIRHRYGRLAFGSEEHLGVRFEIDFKIRRTI